jgi:hypothetical protein
VSRKDERTYQLTVPNLPDELGRGIRMVCARKRVAVCTWVPLLLYEAIDRELADYPEWRWMTKPGEEVELLKVKRRPKR